MTKKLNIAINLRLLLPGRKEGIARFAWETTKRLIINNPQHIFYFIFDRAYDRELIIAKNIVPIVIGPQARHPWLWYWWFEYSLPKVFKKHQIDLFYSPEFYISQRSKVPTLMVSHDIVFETYRDHLPSHQQKYLEKNSPRFHERADHIITVSEFGKQDLVDKYKLDSDKITVAGNACPEGFNPINKDEKRSVQEKYSDAAPYILYVGAIHPRKNVLRMIEAFKLYKAGTKSDLKFIIIGRMAWKSQDVDQAIHYTKDVIYLSNIEDELKQIMAGAELLMFVSLFEGFGIPILEAMKSEIPVITSKVTSMKEVAGDAAILVDPYSVEEIKEGMVQLLENNELAEQLVERGKERLKKYNWDEIAGKVEDQIFALSNK